ncbi:Hypothetical predicted protein [Lecanosticta acicola]|uniref:Uncharacterized protein n=1 Tax=Lecanosticta acicola TaxID=111012 RepID=A0AAI8YTB9_9PEZI|nr:Hypothetical predicted protein [Lecanosticta acicola]
MTSHWLFHTPGHCLTVLNNQRVQQERLQGRIDTNVNMHTRLVLYICIFQPDGTLLLFPASADDPAKQWTVPTATYDITADVQSLQFMEFSLREPQKWCADYTHSVHMLVILSAGVKSPQSHLHFEDVAYTIRYVNQQEARQTHFFGDYNPVPAGCRFDFLYANAAFLQVGFATKSAVRSHIMSRSADAALPYICRNALFAILVVKNIRQHQNALYGLIGHPLVDSSGGHGQVLPIMNVSGPQTLQNVPERITVMGQPHNVISRWQSNGIIEVKNLFDWMDLMSENGRIRVVWD